MASIFVSISSYRDLELKETILDIIDKSSKKHTINFGVHVSYLHPSEINLPDIPNIKYTTSLAPENVGVGMGRYISHQFYNNEDFYFQCDSHSRFVDGWDEIAIHSVLDYQIQGIAKPLITMYPGNYWYKDTTFKEIDHDILDLNYKSKISFSQKPEEFRELRIPSQTAVPAEGEIYTKSISAGCVFTIGPFMAPNKDMAFWGEEIIMAARAYTHGYDMLVPKQQFMYHLYYNHEHPNPEINRRKIFWHDFPEQFEAMNARSREIVYKTLTEGTVGDGLLGTKRTLEQYGSFAGLDFINGEVL